uniref:Uncharacterized protein n=1 Tax=virus sp. ctEfN2 TaxID=2825810 RepID=A0A8S5RN69_9VIRU|nr:MAG TPA: hypothetical protein [virus sp. ctEfN2]
MGGVKRTSGVKWKSWFSNDKSLMSRKQRKHLDRLYNKLFIKNWRYSND